MIADFIKKIQCFNGALLAGLISQQSRGGALLDQNGTMPCSNRADGLCYGIMGMKNGNHHSLIHRLCNMNHTNDRKPRQLFCSKWILRMIHLPIKSVFLGDPIFFTSKNHTCTIFFTFFLDFETFFFPYYCSNINHTLYHPR